jgi:hypothetical protein
MNVSTPALIAAALLTVFSSSPASAMSVTIPELRAEIHSVIPGSGNIVNVFVNHGVVTLTGHVADMHVKYLVTRAADDFAGVTRVHNLLSTRN